VHGQHRLVFIALHIALWRRQPTETVLVHSDQGCQFTGLQTVRLPIQSMKLSVWAEQNGISYRTAWNWFTAGKLPVPAIQTATGTILVKENVERSRSTVIYARVFSSDQRVDLDRQVARLSAFAAQNDLVRDMTEVLTSFCAGLNGRRSAKHRATAAISVLTTSQA